MKIAVVGAGYVGLSNAVLLAQRYEVYLVDVLSEKVDSINRRDSTIHDEYIEQFFLKKKLLLRATLNPKEAYQDASFVLICTPTNYDVKTHCLDTSSVETVIDEVTSANDKAAIIIKSTVPIGFTERVKEKYHYEDIIFSPEFLREGKALYDSLHPSRIILGGNSCKAKNFLSIISNCIKRKEVSILFMESYEAEAVKLFSNAYLAMRIAFFNELDTYAETHSLDSQQVINGVCLDHRIGNYYNNPSFGYGGCCFPKDTKQLLSNYKYVSNDIISAIVSANETRKNFIANTVVAMKPKVVGIYRLCMKKGSDDFRDSAIYGVIKRIKEKGIKIIIYEPNLNENSFFYSETVKSLEIFKENSSIIIANRIDDGIKDSLYKVYSRDIFNSD